MDKLDDILNENCYPQVNGEFEYLEKTRQLILQWAHDKLSRPITNYLEYQAHYPIEAEIRHEIANDQIKLLIENGWKKNE